MRRSPDDVDARRQLATALALSNRPAEARAHFAHARDVARRQGNDRIAQELDEAGLASGGEVAVTEADGVFTLTFDLELADTVVAR